MTDWTIVISNEVRDLILDPTLHHSMLLFYPGIFSCASAMPLRYMALNASEFFAA